MNFCNHLEYLSSIIIFQPGLMLVGKAGSLP